MRIIPKTAKVKIEFKNYARIKALDKDSLAA